MPKTNSNATEVGTIGKNEIRWVSAYDVQRNLKYIITSNKDKSMYYIYDKNYKKLGRDRSPLALERKFFGDK